jgi:hypothetical protein
MILPSKLVGEVITVPFNYIDQIPTGETIVSAVVTCTVIVGTDALPERMIVGAARISGEVVKQWIFTGTPGVIYALECQATISDGSALSIICKLAVLPGDGTSDPFPPDYPTPLIITGAAPDGEVGEPYSYSYTVSGGVPPYSNTGVTTPAIPGLTMPGFELLGTPTVADIYPIAFGAEDRYGQTASHTDEIEITAPTWEEEVLDDGPWYYYKLDEAAALTTSTITDYSGNNRDGTLTSVQTALPGVPTGITAQEPGLIGASTYSFDCSGDATQMTTIQPYIVNSDGLPVSATFKFTIIAVVNTTSHTGRATLIVSSDFGAATGVRHFQTALLDGCPYLALLQGDNDLELLLSTTDIADGEDHVLHFIYDGDLGPADTDKMRIYIDGALDCSKATAFVPDSPAG